MILRTTHAIGRITVNGSAVIAGGCLAVAAALILLAVAAGKARAVERSAGQDRVHDLRVLLSRLTAVSAVCGGLAAGLCIVSPDWPGIGPGAAAATIAVALACLVLPVAAARRPVVAAYARVRGIPVRALRSSPRHLVTVPLVLAVLAWPAAVIVAVGPGGATGIAAALVGYLLVNPVVLGLLVPVRVWARRARALPDEVQQQLTRLSGQIGVRVRGRMVPGRARKVANAWQLGWFPGLRYVLVSDYLLDEFTPSELGAVIAHELGHVRGHDIRTRQLFACLVMVPVGIGAAGVTSQSLALTGVAIVALVPVWVLLRLRGAWAIRRELAADDVAVAAVGPGVVAAMLERLTELNAIKRETSLRWDRQVGHPGMARRIARLHAASPAPAGTPSTGTVPRT
jgi:Zn-dependent protease with chaperone function